MGNIVSRKNVPLPPNLIRDMAPGDSGYTLPWSVNDDQLDESYPLEQDSHGTMTLHVECVAKGRYALDYEGVR